MPKSTDEIPLESTNLFLFVGPADSGKSYAATSWGLRSVKYGGTSPRPAYLLELDGRVSALRGRPVVYDDYTNAEGAIGVLNRIVQLRNDAVRDGKTAYHTLIFDSITAFNDMAIADSLDETIKKNKLNPKEPIGRRRGELQMLTTEDYGYEAEAFRQLLWENIFDLKRYCDIIVVAHEVEKYKKINTKPGEPAVFEPDGYKLLIHGNKLGARLPTKFDEIYHFKAKEVVRAEKRPRWQVCFQDTLARSSYPALKKSTEDYEITDKEFYPFWREKINGK